MTVHPWLDEMITAIESTEDVHLVVPPYTAYLRTVRLVAADAAGRAGLDCEEVSDFRMAVDELCHILMQSTDQLLQLSFSVVHEQVVGRGAATTARPAMLSDLSETIFRSVSDYYELLLEKGRLTFLVIKQASRERVPKL